MTSGSETSVTSDRKPPTGSLTIVGTGIQAIAHLTIEAQANIEHSDVVLYLVTDLVTEHYVRDLNSHAESLQDSYATDKLRMTSYEEMVERMLRPVRNGLRVCGVFYGHPGVFVYPSHEAIRRARKEGYSARMLPAISAEDCLFADLGVEPAIPGCQSFEATDFLLFTRQFDPTSSLILWQIGLIGDMTFQGKGYDYRRGLKLLAEHLVRTYGRDHTVVIYEAAHLPTGEARREPFKLGDLSEAETSPISTLYVPPREAAQLDQAMVAKLGIREGSLARVEREVVLNASAVG